MNFKELEFLLKLNTKQFLAASSSAQASYVKMYNQIDQKPIPMKSSGTAQLLKQFVTIGTALVAVRKAFNDLQESETNMANVASLGVKNIDELRKGVDKIGLTAPVALHDMEKGLYDVVSAGVDASKQIYVLEQSAKSAKAGLAETSDALNLGSAVIKGYGKSWSEFGDVMDQAFQTVKLGQTTFPELASSLGSVIPLASTLNVKTEELFGAMATLTGVTGGAAEVSTQLRGILAATAKPTEELTALFDKYGGAASALKQLGLAEYLKFIATETGGNIEAMAKLVPRVEGLNAVLALSGSQFNTFIEKTEEMRKSSGAMEGAFEKQSETLDSKLTKLDNSFQVLSRTILNGIVPPLTLIIDTTGDLFAWFAMLDSGTQKIIIGGTALAIVLAKLPTLFRAIRTSIISMQAALGPAGWLIIGIGAAATAWEVYAASTSNAADETERMKNVMDDLYKMAVKTYDSKNLQELIGFQEYHNVMLKETKADLAAIDSGQKKASEEEIKTLNERLKYHQYLYDFVSKKITERSEQQIEAETGLTAKELAELDKRKQYQFEQNKITLAQYIAYLNSRKNAVKQSLGVESLEFEKWSDKLTELETKLAGETIKSNVVKTIDLVHQSTEQAIQGYVVLNDISTQFFENEYFSLERNYQSKKLLMEDNLVWAKALYGEESSEYQNMLNKKLEMEANYQASKRSLEAEAAMAIISYGDQIMSAFQGQSKDMFAVGKGLALADATMNMYEGASKAIAKYPPPLSGVMAAIQLALGGAQIAKIASTKFKKGYAGGGMIDDVYNAFGIPAGEDGVVPVRRGEYIVKQRATAKFLPLLEMINNSAAGSGVAGGFAGGGMVSGSGGGVVMTEDQFQKFLEKAAKPEIHITGTLKGQEFLQKEMPRYTKYESWRKLTSD